MFVTRRNTTNFALGAVYNSTMAWRTSLIFCAPLLIYSPGHCVAALKINDPRLTGEL